MRERKNVYKLPASDKTLEWYGKAVIAMKNKPTTDPRSWNYQAAIHGIDPGSPFWKGAAPFPGRREQQDFWNGCQHQSWFFLPWHRMYLAFFEQIVAQTIVDLGGPADWSLPYWDYSDTSSAKFRTIPPAFTSPANATNGLWIKGRVNTTIAPQYVTLEALNTIPYTSGNGRTAVIGFGGPETAFNHFGSMNGRLEDKPHNYVHGYIDGAMGDPNTAALDPIFWLHHCNIDRLWQVWLNQGRRANPVKSSWQDFKFAFNDKNASRVEMKCSEVEDTRKVLSGYTYQGVPAAVAALEGLESFIEPDQSKPLEVVAAINKNLALSSKKTVVQLKLTPSHNKIESLEALNSFNESVSEPKTAILHFENIKGKGVPPIHDVYINVPKGGKNKESYYAGSINFFGLEGASKANLHHAGSGQHHALDISELMNKLRSQPNWNDQELDISLEPIRKMGSDASVKIGRISLYSE